jgi:hypothetical protein
LASYFNEIEQKKDQALTLDLQFLVDKAATQTDYHNQ